MASRWPWYTAGPRTARTARRWLLSAEIPVITLGALVLLLKGVGRWHPKT